MNLIGNSIAWIGRGLLISLGGGTVAIVGLILLTKRVIDFNIRQRMRLYRSFDPMFDNLRKIQVEQRIIAWIFVAVGGAVFTIGMGITISRGF